MRDLLKKIPLFSELTADELNAISNLVNSKKVQRKSIVVQEGEAGESMYIIIRGSVKISYYSSDGQEVVLTVLRGGAFFGEMALLDREPRSATVTTLEDCELGQIRRADFEHLLHNTPSITLKLLTEVVARLRRTSTILERISTMDVPHRLFDFIRNFCEEHGYPENADSYLAKLPTHQLIADQLSTSRETISRAISRLKQEKIIVPIEGRREVRVDMAALDTLLEAIR